ncbi:uncharacterized protein LOC123220521 [Mangifera indica]|uniref:uncharacterized protein LOC123220521 n=1 Tax=Mangifera indica TaxID=29780 RepID=UPI001CFBB473|nr:uncharacterized protein LOC123220521 [Mangifera indica]
MSPCTMPLSLLFLLILADVISSIEATSPTEANGSSLEKNRSQERLMVPLMEEKYVMMVNETRRKLNSFQICALCTCCGGAKGLCLASPCCYAINCNIPNRPFGFCSFTPKACNCFGCHI